MPPERKQEPKPTLSDGIEAFQPQPLPLHDQAFKDKYKAFGPQRKAVFDALVVARTDLYTLNCMWGKVCREVRVAAVAIENSKNSNSTTPSSSIPTAPKSLVKATTTTTPTTSHLTITARQAGKLLDCTRKAVSDVRFWEGIVKDVKREQGGQSPWWDDQEERTKKLCRHLDLGHMWTEFRKFEGWAQVVWGESWNEEENDQEENKDEEKLILAIRRFGLPNDRMRSQLENGGATLPTPPPTPPPPGNPTLSLPTGIVSTHVAESEVDPELVIERHDSIHITLTYQNLYNS